MNKKLLFTCLITLILSHVTIAQSFGPDVIIKSDTVNQRNIEISAAFNGWLYSAYSTVDVAADAGGITISKSVDGGYTWTTMDSYSSTGVRYESLDLVVTGSDTNSLMLFLVGVNHNINTGNYTIFVDNYNATTGNFINAKYSLQKGTNRVYDVEIASDYELPAAGANPYSVALLYSAYSSSYDSVVSVVSIDGGATFANRQTVATTGSYFRNISLDYGRSLSASNGRYFAAWERLPSGVARTGNIFTSRNQSTVDGSWITPVNLDSLSSTMIGLCRNPRIAVSQSANDNDSGSVSSIVTVDRDYTGDGSDYDMLGFYNKRAHYTNFWYRFDVVNSNENDMMSDVLYEDVNQKFHMVYFDSTGQHLNYITNDLNLLTPSTWVTSQLSMNDSAGLTEIPIPRIVFRPTINEIGLAWINEGNGGNGVATFDIESFQFAGIAEENAEFNALLYPNPVKTNLFIEVDDAVAQLPTELIITDLNGRIVRTAQLEGQTTISIAVDDLSNGTYMIRLTNENGFASRIFIKE